MHDNHIHGAGHLFFNDFCGLPLKLGSCRIQNSMFGIMMPSLDE
jgi:hypothetical protein